MKLALAFALLAYLSLASAQGTYGGQSVYQANLAPNAPGDVVGNSGFEFVRISGDTLTYDATLFAAQQITFLDLHLSPTKGAVAGGPLVLRLADISASPQSAGANGQLKLSGSRNSANLQANPMLATARAALANVSVFDNPLNSISDVNRLLAQGLIYGDVHSVTRPPPGRVESGLFFATSGRRKMLRV